MHRWPCWAQKSNFHFQILDLIAVVMLVSAELLRPFDDLKCFLYLRPVLEQAPASNQIPVRVPRHLL